MSRETLGFKHINFTVSWDWSPANSDEVSNTSVVIANDKLARGIELRCSDQLVYGDLDGTGTNRKEFPRGGDRSTENFTNNNGTSSTNIRVRA